MKSLPSLQVSLASALKIEHVNGELSHFKEDSSTEESSFSPSISHFGSQDRACQWWALSAPGQGRIPLTSTPEIEHVSANSLQLTCKMNKYSCRNTMDPSVSEQDFWYLKSQELLGMSLLTRGGSDWKRIYLSLEQGNVGYNKHVLRDSIATTILLKEVNVDPSDKHTILICCEYGFDKTVEVLLEDTRVDPCFGNNMCLLVACDNGHWRVAELLLSDVRVNPDRRTQEDCLAHAIMKNRYKTVQLLLASDKIDAYLVRDIVALARSNAGPGVVQLITDWRSQH